MAKVQTNKLPMKELRKAVKEELEALYQDAEVNKKVTNRDSEFAVKAVANVLIEALVNGNHVGLPNVGTLELRYRGSRMGRNPQTDEKVEIKAHQAVAFVPSGILKNSVK